jgi:hypothetical protein
MVSSGNVSHGYRGAGVIRRDESAVARKIFPNIVLSNNGLAVESSVYLNFSWFSFRLIAFAYVMLFPP